MTTKLEATGTGSAVAFLAFSAGFWLRGGKRLAWPLAGAVLALLLLNLAVNIGLNRWHRWFFDILESRESAALMQAFWILSVLIVAGAAFAVAMQRCRMTLQLEWRRWMTARLLDVWVRQSRNGLSHIDGEHHGSPEYRVVEDVRLALDPVVDLTIGLANALILGVTFIWILITVGGSLRLDVLGATFSVPGYLALAAAAYAALASASMYVIGQPLIRRIAEKNEAEAQFLFELTRHIEADELMKTKPSAALSLTSSSFDVVLRRWRRVIREHCRLTWLTNSNSFFAPMVPLFLTAPKFIHGELSLGAVMQAAAAFGIVLGAMNWFTDNYVRIAEWSASARRVDELASSLLGTSEYAGAAPNDGDAPNQSDTGGSPVKRSG